MEICSTSRSRFPRFRLLYWLDHGFYFFGISGISQWLEDTMYFLKARKNSHGLPVMALIMISGNPIKTYFHSLLNLPIDRIHCNL